VVTLEDHMWVGGLYEAVAGLLAERHPTPMRRASIERIFTTSGEPDELARMYGIDAESVTEVCKRFIGG
jgi:transketolase